jgi:feruloyl-CoA synthase
VTSSRQSPSTVTRDPASLFSKPAVHVARRADRTILLTSPHPLGEYPRTLNEFLLHWTRNASDRLFLCERAPNGNWWGLTYGQAFREVQRIARWLLSEHLSSETPVAILSDNSVEHALLMLAAMHVGIPVIPISPAYSRESRDFAKLKSILSQAQPGVIYIDDYAHHAPALVACAQLHRATVVVGHNSSTIPESALRLDHLPDAGSDLGVTEAYAAVTGDTIAKILFTSGSTDEPKGVINTQRMLCSNQQAKAQVWPFLETLPPIIVDWLPWNHTFGGNHNFNLILRNGGTLYIDGGRPVPALFPLTLRNLRDIAPTIYFNVPRGYDMLVAALRADETLRCTFFRRLQLMFYAAASLPEHVWDALIELSRRTVGEAIALTSAWGSTETAPLATDCHFQAEKPGVIGLPVPGCELKLCPLAYGANGYEVRVRGPLVTPGYWRRPELTTREFDPQGFYKIGDAVRFVDESVPQRGLLFDGRVAEDFKLTTGTWVRVGHLRLRAIAALTPVAQDVVVAGHDRDDVCLLIFPNLAACRTLCPSLDACAPLEEVLTHPRVRAYVQHGLRELHAQASGSSTHASRAVLLAEPPSIDAGEITDKGYINQRAVLTRRHAVVDALYESGDPNAIHLPA